MTRQQVKELLPALTAFANGEQVKIGRPDSWHTLMLDDLVLADLDHGNTLRITPKPRDLWLVIYEDNALRWWPTREEADAFARRHDVIDLAILHVREVLE